MALETKRRWGWGDINTHNQDKTSAAAAALSMYSSDECDYHNEDSSSCPKHGICRSKLGYHAASVPSLSSRLQLWCKMIDEHGHGRRV